jgi:twitching motility protein PilT
MVQDVQAGTEFNLREWLTRAHQQGASDAHFHSGYPPIFRINGSMAPIGSERLNERALAKEIVPMLSDQQKADFKTYKDVDFTYEIPGTGRFRASMFMSQTGLNSSFRIIPPKPSTLAELGLPPELARFTQFHHGIVLITGPAGCGKSSTLGALINLVNETHDGSHILTMEDPIEIRHPNKRCVVNQRQVVLHTESYARAMRAALREDPDVIIIGEMRDAETISLALTAAETGHLVMASMHTTDSIKSISRIVDSFPPDKQAQIRTMLSESLQGVFSQLLVPGADGKSRVLAYELLFVNAAIGSMIRDKKTFQIPSVMQTGKAQGMITLPQSIGELVRSGKVTKEVAKRFVEGEAYF